MWKRPIVLQTPTTRRWQLLLVTTWSVKSLPSSTPWLMMPRSPYLTRIQVMGASGNNPTNGRFSPLLQIFERSSDRRAYDHSTCFVLWIERDDITRNRQMSKWIHLWPDHLTWSANQNNNLFTTMIIEDPTIDDCRSAEDICITMIIWFHRLLCFRIFERFQTSHLSSEWYKEISSRKKREVQVLWRLLRISQRRSWSRSTSTSRTRRWEWSVRFVERGNSVAIHQPTIRNASTGHCVRWLRVSHWWQEQSQANHVVLSGRVTHSTHW